MPLRNSIGIAGLLLATACAGGSDLPPAPSGLAAVEAPAPGFGAKPELPPPPERAAGYDAVGYAAWSSDTTGIAGAHATLSPGTFAEVTALDSGRTILVPIVAVARGGPEIALSPDAAHELGLVRGQAAAVRVRQVNPVGADLAALSAGRPATARPDTPPVLLNALRRKLAGTLGQVTPDVADAAPADPAARVAAAPPPKPRPRATKPARVNPGPGYYVQVAALSDAARARAMARSLGGSVGPAGRFFRIRLGPFATSQAAQARRDAVARRGYGDARIVRE